MTSKVSIQQEKNVNGKLISRFDKEKQDEIKSSDPKLLERHVFVIDEMVDHPLSFAKNAFKDIVSGIPYCGTNVIEKSKIDYIKKNIETCLVLASQSIPKLHL